MSSWTWKIRQAVSNLIPIAVIGAIVFGGWHFYKKGTFRHGIAPAVSSTLRQIPYFGSRFKHYSTSSGSSYAVRGGVRSTTVKRSGNRSRRRYYNNHHNRKHRGRTRHHR